MKPAEIAKLSDDELIETLKTSRAELFNLRFRLATGQLDDTSKISAVKKDIARVQTEIRARQIAAAAATEPVVVGADT
jgi:large subunit ribosomal protein L29